MKEGVKRLFFGVEVQAPWPSKLPQGRLLDENHRHFTLAFLGNIPYLPLNELLNQFPQPQMKLGTVGYFDSCLTLPSHHPNVVAWHAKWLNDNEQLIIFQKKLIEWLKSYHYEMDQRPWNPHVTLCRKPFNPNEWQKAFKRIPFCTKTIHLYESVGSLHYEPIWSHFIESPFEEIDHTADIAFIIKGQTLQELYCHAFIALAFKAPEFLDFFLPRLSLKTLDDLIIALNDSIGQFDRKLGCPFKAVSFHGEIQQINHAFLQWEMIVDV